MAEQLTRFCLFLADPALGWLLRLPSEWAVTIVALATALILRGVRRFTTDQDLLHRAAADRRRLKECIREARRRGDREAVLRHKAVVAQVAFRTLGQEWRPLLVSIVPVAVLAVWCFSRLEFHPPGAGEPVEVVLYTPVSSIGEFAHLVPTDGVEADGWVRAVAPDAPGTNAPPANGIAMWTVRAETGSRELTFRVGDGTLTREFRAGLRTYAEPIRFHDAGFVTQLRMREARFLGLVPGIPRIGFAPWLVAYLAIVCAAFPLIRRITGIY
jgi:uncharacterized membrane protein (DUF106 family)